eukprot:9480617-Pyramimonas_sp.AAC.1
MLAAFSSSWAFRAVARSASNRASSPSDTSESEGGGVIARSSSRSTPPPSTSSSPAFSLPPSTPVLRYFSNWRRMRIALAFSRKCSPHAIANFLKHASGHRLSEAMSAAGGKFPGAGDRAKAFTVAIAL